MRKLGFRFSAIPRDRHPEWFEVPLFTRMLCHELYAASCADSGQSKPIPVAGDWRVTLCKLLCIEAKDRGAVRAALSTMEQHGMVRIEDGFVHIVWLASAGAVTGQPGGSRGAAGGQPGGSGGGRPELTLGNDSGLDSRKEEIRQEERREIACAREDFGGGKVLKTVVRAEPLIAARGARWLSDATGGPEPYSHSGKWGPALAELGGKPDGERAVAAKILATEAAKPGVLEMLTPQHVVDHWPLYRVGKAPGARRVNGSQPSAAPEPPKTEAGKLLDP